LFRVPRPGGGFLQVSRIENGLRSLSSDAPRKVQIVRIEMTGWPGAERDEPQRLAFDPDRRQQ
jgi:hypothetical protein